ncbi:Thioesterase/thiol ester dehydrase-isomerase [Apiospora kogelbergensis]|uniref:Thioesterase/thiol ester dehydrase-isomerase n=1 Tax=Apiospora kogelbergensis TaxID=1337665 RepID=UPI003131F0A0
MASKNSLMRNVLAAASRTVRRGQPGRSLLQARCIHATSSRHTDGVFRGLTDDRLPTPWIEAFRQQQSGEGTGSDDALPHKRDMSPKKMSDSYHRVVLPLGQDPWLSDTYINSSGHIRLGTVFMDLDALSGIIVYKHTGPGVTTVTAALDRITIAHPLTEICDLEYSGQVTYASGRSSLEITCKVARARPEGEPSKPEDVLLTCTFTMVALDSTTKKPVNVPRLEYTTPQEERIFKAGEAKSLAKKQALKTSLLQTEPNDAESALVHRMWLQQVQYHDPNDDLRKPANVIPMAKTQLSTAAIMQPQYRNRHQTMIFGVAYTDPPLLEEDGTQPQQGDAERPVTRVHVRVDSKVRDVEHGYARPTGQFNYTFSVPKDIKVLPHTYQEFMMYIDARRRVQLGDVQLRQEQTESPEKQRRLADDASVTE